MNPRLVLALLMVVAVALGQESAGRGAQPALPGAGRGAPPAQPPLGVTPKPAIANAKPARSCESLATVALPNTIIESAAIDPGNPGICRVAAITTHPPAGDKVRIWIGIPVANWNGRFMGQGGGGSEGVAGLQGMAALDATVTAPALADVDVELPVDRPARDLDLELAGHVGLVERAAAVGAGARQRRLVDLVHLFGLGWLAVCLGAVVGARPSAGLDGVVLGRSLGEGCGLALAVALGLPQQAGQALDLSFELCEAALEVGDDLVALPSAQADRGIHTLVVAGRLCRRAAERRPPDVQTR